MKQTRFLFACVAFILVLAVLCGCMHKEDLWKNATYTADTSLGEGSFFFTLIVEAADKSVTLSIATNTVYLGQALFDLGIIEGQDSTYGMYIEKVNGILADYSKNGAWWGVYINGDAAQTGIDSIAITSGAVYTLRYER